MASVLIVDDERGLRETLSLFLQREGHETAQAEDVPHARAILAEREFDVVMLDLIMPGENGLSLLADVRRESPATQVVMVTGEPSIDSAAEALRQGAFDYLPKPVRRETLVRVVARAAQVKRLADENARLDAELRRHHDELEILVAARTRELQAAHTELEGAYRNLKHTLDGTVQAMARLVESRDPYTAGHQRRVAAIAAAIGRELGLDAETREALALSAVVHDVGKIGVPAEILAKPTRLTPLERRLIEQHAEIGYGILSPIEFPWPIADIVRQHHERQDGSGYPQHLVGDAIRLEARVLAVADVVEAISSHRPYRPALGLDVALEELERHRGTIYDERVVAACLGLFRERGFQIE